MKQPTIHNWLDRSTGSSNRSEAEGNSLKCQRPQGKIFKTIDRESTIRYYGADSLIVADRVIHYMGRPYRHATVGRYYKSIINILFYSKTPDGTLYTFSKIANILAKCSTIHPKEMRGGSGLSKLHARDISLAGVFKELAKLVKLTYNYGMGIPFYSYRRYDLWPRQPHVVRLAYDKFEQTFVSKFVQADSNVS